MKNRRTIAPANPLQAVDTVATAIAWQLDGKAAATTKSGLLTGHSSGYHLLQGLAAERRKHLYGILEDIVGDIVRRQHRGSSIAFPRRRDGEAPRDARVVRQHWIFDCPIDQPKVD